MLNNVFKLLTLHKCHISYVFFFQVTNCASSLAPPTYGNITCTHGREVGSECTFTCSTDYELNGSTIRTCIDSGNTANWNGSETNCTGKCNGDEFEII